MKDETKCLHAGYHAGERRPPRGAYCAEHHLCALIPPNISAPLFDMPTAHMYSRFANPTCEAVEKKIAALEGGVGAMLTSSGQAASLLSILNVCNAGDSFISTSHDLRGDRQPVCRHR